MRDEQSGWIELHAGEFALLWGALGLGELPAMLGIPAFGRTPEAREQWIGSASAALEARGLGTVERPADDLTALLRSFGAADQALELQVDDATTALRGLGVSGPEGAAALARADTTVRVGPAHEVDLVQTMLAVPPLRGPGSGISANLPVADYAQACAAGVDDGVGGFVNALSRRGVRREECLMLSRALSTRTAGGRLTARAVDARGKWHRAPVTVGWLDAEDGRYALRSDGEWLTVTPADYQRLVTMAEEMLAAAT